jgi:hypothetical protein
MVGTIGPGPELDAFMEDYDWRSAFGESLVDCYDDKESVKNVVRVIASAEGENDGENWLAIVEWSGNEGKFAVMEAGCCYTGWDCRGGGTIEFYDSKEVACVEITPEQAGRLGLPHDGHKGILAGEEKTNE